MTSAAGTIPPGGTAPPGGTIPPGGTAPPGGTTPPGGTSAEPCRFCEGRGYVPHVETEAQREQAIRLAQASNDWLLSILLRLATSSARVLTCPVCDGEGSAQ